jgi:hypothetical protein
MSWCRRFASAAAASSSSGAPRTRRTPRVSIAAATTTTTSEAIPLAAPASSVVQAPPKPAQLSKKAKADEVATSASFLVKAPYLFSVDLGIKKIAYCLYSTFGESQRGVVVVVAHAAPQTNASLNGNVLIWKMLV